MLLLRDGLGEPVDVQGVLTEYMGRDLTMQHPGGDVRVVWRNLPPAALSGIRGHAHEGDELVTERLDTSDLHALALRSVQNTMTLRNASPRLTEAMASLISSSA